MRQQPSELDQAYAGWLAERATRSASAKAYMLTMTFDRYRDRYATVDDGGKQLPDRHDVYAGVTAALPRFEAFREYTADVHRWYLRVLRRLLGRNYRDHYDRQPFAIGHFDQPVFKHHDASGLARLRSADRFPHLHMVMVVDGLPTSGEAGELSTAAFERAYEEGALGVFWRQQNPAGELHMALAYDIAGALDYAAKTAKRDRDSAEHMILLPFDGGDEDE